MLGRKLDSWEDTHGRLTDGDNDDGAAPVEDDNELQRAILLSMSEQYPPRDLSQPGPSGVAGSLRVEAGVAAGGGSAGATGSGLAPDLEALQLRRDEAIALALSDANETDGAAVRGENHEGQVGLPPRPLEEEEMQEAIRRSLIEAEAEVDSRWERGRVTEDGRDGLAATLGAAAVWELMVGPATITLGEFVKAVENIATADWPDWLPFPDVVDDENPVVSNFVLLLHTHSSRIAGMPTRAAKAAGAVRIV